MTKPRSLRRDARRNRDLLVAAARRVFASRGLEVPLEDIAKEAGVSIGTLYNRFPTRGTLVEAALADKVAAMVAQAETAATMTDPWEGFAWFLARCCETQQAGQLRTDFHEGDFAFVLWSTTTIIDATAATTPDAWRRHLAFLLDGLRATAADPLPSPPLRQDQVAEAMRTHGG